MDGDCENNSLSMIEPVEIKSDLITAKAAVKHCNDRIVPVRVLNLYSYEKIVSINSELGECVEKTTINPFRATSGICG